MSLAVRISFLLCLASTLVFAGTWSGVLVDSGCWASEEHNVRDTAVYVDRDRNLEVNACAPKAGTKSFALVKLDGTSVLLDSAGNQKAQEIVRSVHGKSVYRVSVTGNETANRVTVGSIVPVQ